MISKSKKVLRTDFETEKSYFRKIDQKTNHFRFYKRTENVLASICHFCNKVIAFAASNDSLFVKFSVSVSPSVNENNHFFIYFFKFFDVAVRSIKKLHIILTKTKDNLDSEMVIL